MPKPDACQPNVAAALQKDGWQILQTDLFIDDDFTNALYLDLQISRPPNGSRTEVRFIEVKCFAAPRTTPELHRALGQAITYGVILDREGFPDPLYLAVPQATFQDYFNEAILEVVRRHDIHLLVVDLEQERIVQWIP